MVFLEEYRLHREMTVAANAMPFPLGISYCLSGRVVWSMEGRREQFTTRRGECELLLAGHANGNAIYGSDEPVVMVNIMLCPMLLKSFFDTPFDHPDNVDILGLWTNRDLFFYRKNAIPGCIHSILKQLMHSSCRRPAEKLFVQSKVMELVAFQLDQLDTSGRSTDTRRATPSESVMVARAKSILKTNMQSPPSLNRLARLLGTNETKLKKSFATNCGTTVYGYLRKCRMQRASELLKNSALTMSEIGAEVGYSERTHFSRAFSRYYGISPSQYRSRTLPTVSVYEPN